MIYFTSDQHHGHTNIIKYSNRPFETLEEMDDEIIEKYNKVITNKDIVYFLGDFSFYDDDKTKQIFKRYNGTKHLILGNHDEKRTQLYLKLFQSVNHYKEIKYNKQRISMMHYAMLTWSASHYGSWMLCGHSHSTIDDINREAIKKGFFRWDCGVDGNNFSPVSFDELKEKIFIKDE